MADSVTITLKKPLRAHGKDVEEITLREPTGEDITVCGYPLIISEGAAQPVAGAISKYIARLGGLPPSSVKPMSADDYNACMGAILGFFGSSGEEVPTPD